MDKKAICIKNDAIRHPIVKVPFIDGIFLFLVLSVGAFALAFVFLD